MSNIIQVEFCGGWCFGYVAGRVKILMEDNYPKAKIDYRSAKGVTGKIEVSWIKGGKKEIVWSAGRSETSQNEELILKLMQERQWRNWNHGSNQMMNLFESETVLRNDLLAMIQRIIK